MQHPIHCPKCSTTFYLPELPPVPTSVFCPKCRHVLEVVAPPRQMPSLTRIGIFVGIGAAVVFIGILIISAIGVLFPGKSNRLAPVGSRSDVPVSGGPAATPVATPSDRPQEPPEETLSRLLTQARSGEMRQRQIAIRQLGSVPIVESRRAGDWEEVQRLLVDPDPAIRALAMMACPHWESKPGAALERLMAQADAPRTATITALGTLGDEPSIQLLIAVINSNNRGSDLAAAIAALRHIGPSTEAALTPLLNHSGERVRLEICNLLRSIGSSASLPELRELSQKDPSSNVRTAASSAIRAIQER